MKRRPCPRPRMFKLCVFILALASAGAIINIAVAWGLIWGDSWLPAASWSANGLSYDHSPEWKHLTFVSARSPGRARAYCGWHGKDVHVRVMGFPQNRPAPFESVVPPWAISIVPRATDSRTADYTRLVDLRGWPCVCLQSLWEAKRENGHRNSDITTTMCIVIADRPGTPFMVMDLTFPRMLPGQPLWPGFAINTLFYAAVLWVLFAGPGWVRRRLVIRGRARRGLCPACAYPIGTNPVCTECGKQVTPRPEV